jgi:hypothetical protein
MTYNIISTVEFIPGFWILTFSFTFKCNETDEDITFEQSIFITSLDDLNIQITDYLTVFIEEFCASEQYTNLVSERLAMKVANIKSDLA